MRKIKHSKYKNTGMLFELLARQVTADIISGNETAAPVILKEHFHKSSELLKEYRLYKTLAEETLPTETKCQMLIEAVLKARKKLDAKKLRKEKYNLISSLSENFDIDSFFQTKVNNYKLLASIYKIFEYNELDNPAEITRSKITIIENMNSDNNNTVLLEDTAFDGNSKDIKLLSYKILIEKFNNKYENLLPSQKEMLREYINNVSNTNNLLFYVQKEAESLKEILTKKHKRIKDKTVKIKLKEAIDLLDSYQDIKRVEENHVTALLRYYEIVNDLDGEV